MKLLTLLTLIATIMASVVAIGLWQAEMSSKSLSIKLATLISIQPKEQGAISGIEILVDGTRLVNPHLVIFEIRNNGRKPIPAADYESPLQINVVSETKLVRANITDKAPNDIEATLMSESQNWSLKPMLLNPGDTVSVTAITSGDPPSFQSFQSKTRIVGISNVVLEDGTTKKPNKIGLVILLLGSALSLTSAWLMSDAVKKSGVFLRRRAAAFVGIVALVHTTIMLQNFLERIEIQGFWYIMLSSLILMFPAGFIASVLNRNQKTTASDEVAK